MYHNLSKNPAILAAVAAAYFALGRIGLAAGGFTEASALWPASGFALAAMLLFGRGVWTAIFVGAFIEHAASTGQIAPSMLVATGNALEALVGAALVERVADAHLVFKRADQVFRFIAIAAFVATPLSATLGALAQTVMGFAPWDDFVFLLMTGWLSHLCGILVVTSFIILWATKPIARVKWLQLLEGAVLLAMIAAVGLLVFGGWFPADVQSYPLEFLSVPLLLWAAFRVGRRQTATATLIISGMSVWGTLHGYGPFVRDSPHESLVLVQVYTTVMAITGLVMATTMSEHRSAQAQLRELATTDPLTGLANYRRLIEVLRGEIARSSRTGRPFAVLFVDMNGLKTINDRYGHLVGSRALSRIADALRQSIRKVDTPARYGGDEFAIVLTETTEEGGKVVLRRVFERLLADPGKPAISVSGGVAVYPRDGESPTLLLRAADQLLYAAKASHKAAQQTENPSAETAGTLV